MSRKQLSCRNPAFKSNHRTVAKKVKLPGTMDRTRALIVGYPRFKLAISGAASGCVHPCTLRCASGHMTPRLLTVLLLRFNPPVAQFSSERQLYPIHYMFFCSLRKLRYCVRFLAFGNAKGNDYCHISANDDWFSQRPLLAISSSRTLLPINTGSPEKFDLNKFPPTIIPAAIFAQIRNVRSFRSENLKQCHRSWERYVPGLLIRCVAESIPTTCPE